MFVRIAGLIALVAALIVGNARTTEGALITFTSGGFSRTSIGDRAGFGFDKLFVQSLTATLDLSENVSQTAIINPFQFVVGNTGTASSGLVETFGVNRFFSANGVTGSVSQTAQVTIGSLDSLFFFTGFTTTFDLGSAGVLDVTPLGLNFGARNIGTWTGTLSGRFLLHDVPVPPTPVPEPATLALVGSGILAGLARRRLVVNRRRVS